MDEEEKNKIQEKLENLSFMLDNCIENAQCEIDLILKYVKELTYNEEQENENGR